MRFHEIITEAPPAGIKRKRYANWKANVEKRAAERRADITNPRVVKKLAAQNYAKWVKYIRAKDAASNDKFEKNPEAYKAELIKFFSSNGKLKLGQQFTQAVANSDLSVRSVKSLVQAAIGARAEAKNRAPDPEPTPEPEQPAAPEQTPAPTPEPSTEPKPDANGQYNIELPGGSGDAPQRRPDSVVSPAPSSNTGQSSFDFDAKPEPTPAPAPPQPKAPKQPKASKPPTVKVAGEPWTWDGEKWRNAKGAAAGAGMAAAIEGFLKDQNK